LDIRRVESCDVEAILAIRAVSPEIAQWTLWDYERVARGEMAGWVGEEAGQIIGFLVARQVVTDIEILNLAVRPDARRRGVGGALLAKAIAWSREFQGEKALLEVRASNLAALQFYERHHFQAAGRRTRYYTAPVDDALVLSLKLT
jgi:ribosomal-protein-alanine N-acetyltransferase